jgi:hypothetical protein
MNGASLSVPCLDKKVIADWAERAGRCRLVSPVRPQVHRHQNAARIPIVYWRSITLPYVLENA